MLVHVGWFGLELTVFVGVSDSAIGVSGIGWRVLVSVGHGLCWWALFVRVVVD